MREVTQIRVGGVLTDNDEIADAETDIMMDSVSCIPFNDNPEDATREDEPLSPSTTQQLGRYGSVDQNLTRHKMSVQCFRDGEARYAVKQLLLDDATEKESDNVRIDLAIEVKYLQVLSHPHVIKLRGLFKTDDPFHPAYFFVMDRLYGTLENKIDEWSKRRQSRWKGVVSCFRRSACFQSTATSIEDDFLVQRLLVAYDIASAFDYLHRNKIVHR